MNIPNTPKSGTIFLSVDQLYDWFIESLNKQIPQGANGFIKPLKIYPFDLHCFVNTPIAQTLLREHRLQDYSFELSIDVTLVKDIYRISLMSYQGKREHQFTRTNDYANYI